MEAAEAVVVGWAEKAVSTEEVVGSEEEWLVVAPRVTAGSQRLDRMRRSSNRRHSRDMGLGAGSRYRPMMNCTQPALQPYHTNGHGQYACVHRCTPALVVTAAISEHAAVRRTPSTAARSQARAVDHRTDVPSGRGSIQGHALLLCRKAPSC